MRTIRVDMPVDSARKLSKFLYQSSKEWDTLAEALHDIADEAGDGVTVNVSGE